MGRKRLPEGQVKDHVSVRLPRWIIEKSKEANINFTEVFEKALLQELEQIELNKANEN